MTKKPLTDLAGHAIPTPAEGAGIPHVLAIPPIRQTWNPNGIDFFQSYGLNLAPTTANQQLTGSILNFTVPDRYSARIDYIVTWAPDLVLAAVPYIFFNIFNNGAILAPFKRIPIFPKVGLSQLTFNVDLMLGPNSVITATGENADAATHFFGFWIHGWIWPTALSDE